MRAFTLPDCFTHSLTVSPQCCVPQVLTSLPHWEVIAAPGQSCRKSDQFPLIRCSRVPVFDITGQGPWAPLAFLSTQLSDLQGLSSLPGSFLQPGSSSSAFQAPFSFPRPLILAPALLSWPPSLPFFLPKQLMCGSRMCDQPSNWWFCLMFSYQLEDSGCVALFSLSITKIYNQPTQAAATKQQPSA